MGNFMASRVVRTTKQAVTKHCFNFWDIYQAYDTGILYKGD